MFRALAALKINHLGAAKPTVVGVASVYSVAGGDVIMGTQRSSTHSYGPSEGGAGAGTQAQQR